MATQIQSGTNYYGINYFNANTSGWTLLGSTGTRQFIVLITFPVQFASIPAVQVGLTSFDVLPGGSGMQLDVQATDPSITGFYLQMTAWECCKVMGLGVSWLAVAA